jgi:ADP-heptose:LPS heptosyltransferase
MRILVISLAGIGDTLFATPLIRELRTSFPAATIDALVMWRGSKDLLEGNPHLNTIYQQNLIKLGYIKSLQYVSQFRENRYDVSFNTHPQSRIQYRITARLINARMRVSHQYDNASNLDGLLVNRRINQDYHLHSIENNLAFLTFVGAKPTLQKPDYEIFLSPEEMAWSDEFVGRERLGARKLLGIHVGSGGTKNLALRRWPLENYRELVTRLCRKHADLTVLLLGGPEEQKDHEQLLSQAGAGHFVHPKTDDLRHAAALIRKCHVFLSVDTALMHIAAAMKVPKQIVIETPTWNRPIEPRRQSFTLVPNPAVAGRNLEFYRYDGHGIRGSDQEIIRAMQSVSVDAVQEAVEKAITSVV